MTIGLNWILWIYNIKITIISQNIRQAAINSLTSWYISTHRSANNKVYRLLKLNYGTNTAQRNNQYLSKLPIQFWKEIDES
jgi:hypothetical protein